MSTQYITNRLNPQIEYYDNKSTASKRLYYGLSIGNIVLLGLIPVVSLTANSFPAVKYAVALAGAVASIQTGILTFMKLKENWLASRDTCEALKSEREKYRCFAGVYRECGSDGADALLTERCEEIMCAERSSWSSRMSQTDAQK